MSTSTKKTPQSRFLRRGISKILWVTDLHDPKYPSRREINSAFSLTDAVSDIEGWALENDPIETPDMGSVFNSSIPGNDKAEKSSLTFYEDQFSDAIEQQLYKGAKGYAVLLRKGDIPGSRSVDVFPVQVATRAATYSTGNEAAKFKVDFTVTDEPSLDRPVPQAQHRPVSGKDCDTGHHQGHHGGDHDGDHVDVTVVSTTKTTETEATVREHDADEG
ncbi:phage tail tube protein [Streptomyces decoyicus]